jgi:DNA-binding response OmpR family regulator
MPKLPSLLFVDDDLELCKLVASQVDTALYAIEFAHDAAEAEKKLTSAHFDLLLLDIIMPGMNGIELGKKIRKQYPQMPLIFLTAQTEFQYKMLGFEAGADDYISKPFNFTELMYRIKALLRRTFPDYSSEAGSYTIGEYAFNSIERKLVHAKESKTLSIKESELLQILSSKMNTIVSRDEFLKKVWGKTDEVTIDSMDVYMTRLRKQLRHDENVRIENIRGTGFRLTLNSSVEP